MFSHLKLSIFNNAFCIVLLMCVFDSDTVCKSINNFSIVFYIFKNNIIH